MLENVNSAYTNPEVVIMHNPDIWKIHDNCSHEPNELSLEALEEAEEIINQIESGERIPFNSIDELMADLLGEDE